MNKPPDFSIIAKPKVASNVRAGEWKYNCPGYDVADCIAPITGPLQGEFKDWPQMIQDTLFIAAGELAMRTGKPYELYHCICDHDPDGWYVRAICIAPVFTAPPGTTVQ